MLCYRNTVTRNPWEPIVPTCGTNIKIERIEVHKIKTEPMDTSENIVDDYTASNPIRSSRGKFNCEICLNIFNNYEKLVIHKYFSHKEKPYLCKICNEKFTLSAHLNIHLNEHVDYLYMKESSLQTNIQSTSKSHLEQDLNKLNMSITSTSNICDKIVKNGLSVQNPNISEFTLPLKSTRTRKSFKCIVCKFLTMSEAKFSHHQQICNQVPTSSRTYNRPNCCKLCHRKFMNQTALNGHMRYHSLRGEIISKRKNALNNKKSNSQKENGIIKSTINKPIYVKETGTTTMPRKCKDCNKMFTTYNKLNIHLLQHKKQMMCKLCNKQFFLKKSFEKHLLSHNHFEVTNNHQELGKSMKCESLHTQTYTNNKFKKAIDSKKKQKLLITIKPYQCSYCKQFFSTERSLEEHIRQVHTELKPPVRNLKLESAKCNWCNAVITKANLFRHIKSLHPEINSVKCSYCLMKFKDFPSMKLHVSVYHRN